MGIGSSSGGGPGTGRPIYVRVRSIGPNPKPVYQPARLAGSLAPTGETSAKHPPNTMAVP